MRIAVLKYGREKMGGHSAFLSELQYYCNENNHELRCFSYSIGAKKRKQYKFEMAENFVFDEFCSEDLCEVAAELEMYDLLIMLEPATKAGTKEEGQLYTKMYTQVKKPKKWLLSYNIKLGFIKRVRDIIETIAASDVVSTHSEDAEWCIIGRKSSKTWLRTPLFKRIDEYNHYFENEDRNNEILFAGRYENYKGSHLMPLISKKLHENGIKCSMIGIDRSPASYHGLLITEEVTSGRIDVQGPYKMTEGYERMSKALFSFAPMKLTKEECSGILEYSQVEGIACGCIPVLHKNSKEFEFNGKKFKDIPYFAIWFDDENPDECVEKIIEVSKDKSLQEAYKGVALHVLKEMYHKDNLRKTIDLVIREPKNRCTKEDVLKSFDWNKEEIDLYNEADKTEHYIKQDLLNLNKKTISMITGRYGGTTPYKKGE